MTNQDAIKILKPLFEQCKGSNECLGYIEHFFTKHEEEALDLAIKALEAWGKVKKDIHTAIDNALMYGYGDNYINACETILQIIQKQEKCVKMDKAESEVE